MVRLKALVADQTPVGEFHRDGEDQLLLIDDASFVNAFAEAAQRQGDRLICVQCADPDQALRALILMVDGENCPDEAAGSVGFCSGCYRDLAELIRHGAVLRATKSIDS